MRRNTFSLCTTVYYLYCEQYGLHIHLLIIDGYSGSWGGSLVILEKKKTLANQKLNQGVKLEQKISNFCTC